MTPAAGSAAAFAVRPELAAAMQTSTPLPPYKIGILGTANIADRALIRPARDVPEVRVDAVASRSAERGRDYAAKFGIARSLDYDALIRDPQIDIVYIALPPSLHAEWSIKALETGKHVLCEKPMTANGKEAEQVVAAVKRSKRVYMEAYHYCYHPFGKRVRDLVDTRAIGTIRSVEASLDVPAQRMGEDNIRRQFALGGGALMDAGCYALRFLCEILGEVQRVIDAKAEVDPKDRQVDMTMSARLAFAGGKQGLLHATFLAVDKLVASAIIRADAGTISINQPYVPHSGGSLSMDWDGHHYVEQAIPTPSYLYQLRELVRCIRDGAPVLTSAENGARLMRSIDAIYAKAGLKPRGTV